MLTKLRKNIRFNVDNIDNYLKIKYSYKKLNEILYEENN